METFKLFLHIITSMDKFELFDKIIEDLDRKGYQSKTILKESKSNPAFEISKENKTAYLTICEVGIKPAKYPEIVFCGISPKIQRLIELEKTFVVIIDHQPSKLTFILTKLNKTNYRHNKIDYLIFHFKRPRYGNFFNTENLNELVSEIQSIVTG